MKRKIVRFMSVLLSVSLLLTALPISALAVQQGAAELLESTEQPGGEPLLSIEPQLGAKGDYDNGDFYGQLTTRQKACYDALESITIDQIFSAATIENNGKSLQRVRLSVTGMTGVELPGSFSGGKFQPDSAAGEKVSAIYTDLCAAICALRYDRPDIIWLGYLYYGYWVSQSKGQAARVTDVVFDFYLQYDGAEKTMWETMMANAEKIAESAKTQSDTYQKVLSVHDAIAEDNSYGSTDTLLSHSPYSALVTDDDTLPVCDGYAKAVKIVLDLLEIPNCTASSATHMWNNVRMDDGEWYNIDLTWDDTTDELSHDYFLVGSQSEIDGKVFSKQTDHVEENPYDAYRKGSTVLNSVSFVFPTKSKTAYVYQNGDYTTLRFADVKRSQWYYEHIENAAELGLFSGDDNGFFRPNEKITRAEFASVVAKAMGVDTAAYAGKSSFKDVKTTAWYSGAAAWAKESGVMSGDETGKFRPNDYITRQEMCVVLYNAAEEHVAGNVTFPDDAKIAAWAKKAVEDCLNKHYVSGDEKGNFNPINNTTRAEAAVVCSRFAKLDGAFGDTGDTPQYPLPSETDEE